MVFILLLAQYGVAVAQPYDLVLANGRVMDPESGLDAVRSIAIVNGRIVAITEETLQGTQVIDVGGLVVSPGFIDILSYRPNGYGEWFKVADGVTTNLCLHGIDGTMEDFLAREERNDPPVNYGGATDQYEHRKALGANIGYATEAQIAELADRAEADLLAGAVGIHEQPEYVIGVTFEEMLTHGRVAARLDGVHAGAAARPRPPARARGHGALPAPARRAARARGGTRVRRPRPVTIPQRTFGRLNAP